MVPIYRINGYGSHLEIITAVNPHIGYEAAARVAKEAIATGQSVRELCVKNGVLSQEDLELILDPFEMTHPGIAFLIALIVQPILPVLYCCSDINSELLSSFPLYQANHEHFDRENVLMPCLNS